MTLKGFCDEFGRLLCKPFPWCKINSFEIVASLLAVPKVNKLSLKIYLKKKEILLPWEKKKVFN